MTNGSLWPKAAEPRSIISSAGMSAFRTRADVGGLKCGPAGNDPKRTLEGKPLFVDQNRQMELIASVL